MDDKKTKQIRTVSEEEFLNDPDGVIDFAFTEGEVVVQGDAPGVRMTFSTQTDEIEIEL